MGFRHRRFESVPRQDALNRGKGIAACSPGRDQRLADPRIEPQFLVDGLAAAVKFIGVRAFCLLEQTPEQMLEHIDRFIR